MQMKVSDKFRFLCFFVWTVIEPAILIVIVILGLKVYQVLNLIAASIPK